MIKHIVIAALLAIAPMAASAQTIDKSVQGTVLPDTMKALNITQDETFKKIGEALAEAEKAAEEAKPAELVVSEDYGGAVFEYIKAFNKVRREGIKVRITDYCLSACTQVLGLVPKSQVCVEERATFGFHSAYYQNPFTGEIVFAKEATRVIWNMFPHEVQDLLRARGWDGDGATAHFDFLYVKGTDLYPLCN